MVHDREWLNRFSGEDRTLAAHIYDKMLWCQNHNAPANTMFLTPHEGAVARQVVSFGGYPLHKITGGWEGAERCVLIFLPDYISPEALTEEDLPFGAVRVAWGQNRLTHRDVLGSLMATGIRRDVLGDLLVGENGCDVLVMKECIPFLRDNWLAAGKIGLHPQEICLSELQIPQENAQQVRDTVASLRLDAVLGSGFSLSRGKASAYIEAGRVLLNGCECTKCDRQLSEGDTISVRGLGRLVLREAGSLSKKGRIFISLDRFH